MEINTRYLEQEFFATIDGVDIKSLSKSEFLEIKKAVETYGVVVINSQNINDDDQINFSEGFGKLEISIGTQTKAPDYQAENSIRPEISRISNVDLNNKMLPFDDKKVDARYALETWENKPRKYSISDLKDCICEHSIVYSRKNNTGDIFDDKFKKDMPFVKQRLIRIHPYTKRPAFYAGSHCSHIIGWDLEGFECAGRDG